MAYPPRNDVRVKRGKRAYNNSFVGYQDPVTDRHRKPVKKSIWKGPLSAVSSSITPELTPQLAY